MKEHWSSYQDGLHRWQELIDHLLDHASKEMHIRAEVEKKLKMAYGKSLDEAQGLVWSLMNAIVQGISEGISQMLIVTLYVMFWLMQPLPTGGKASAVVRSYLAKKSIVSVLYGLCTAILFLALGIDLAVFFGVVSFFLNFIPEVGAFISMVIPVPVILLDGRLKFPGWVLIFATTGQVMLKFIIGNILEVKLIERDREMNIHPVWIILSLSYFGYTWGPLGALMSVPMLAMVKTALLSLKEDADDTTEGVVAALAELVIAFIEGRKPIWDGQEKPVVISREESRPLFRRPSAASSPAEEL